MPVRAVVHVDADELAVHPWPDGPVSRLDLRALAIPLGDPRLARVAAAVAGCHPNELVWITVAPQAAAMAVASGGCVVGAPGEVAGAVAARDTTEAAAADAVGVGPHPEPWPDDPRLDPELLAAGDRRNVVDAYRYWREEAIVADLDTRRHPVHVAVENWQHDRNIGAVVRNANACNVAGVHIVGRRRWNRRGAMATDRYLTVHHHDTVEAFLAWAGEEGLAVIAVDNVAGSVPIESADLPERCVLVFGQEGPGLSDTVLAAADLVVAITQYGSTRSLNAGVASGIALHVWARHHAG